APGALVVLEGLVPDGGAPTGAAREDRGAGSPPWAQELLRQLPGVHEVFTPEHGSGSVALRPLDTPETLRGLIELQQAGRFSLRGLRVEHATLEDVFLSLTGRGLRE